VNNGEITSAHTMEIDDIIKDIEETTGLDITTNRKAVGE
jgi:hypothetical protein